MWTGEVDADWARQHHSVWYEEVKEHGDRSNVRPTQTTPAH
jgi:cytochrome b subunit of formate dehydrogenase